MKKLKSLDLRHKAAARMKVEGKNQDYISKELNVTKRTLSLWFSDDLVKEEIQRLSSAVDEMFAEKLAQSGLTALEEMLQFGQRDTGTGGIITEGTKLRALESVLDRIPALSKVRDRSTAGSGDAMNIENLAVLIGKMPDQELATTARKLLSRASGDGTDPVA